MTLTSCTKQLAGAVSLDAILQGKHTSRQKDRAEFAQVVYHRQSYIQTDDLIPLSGVYLEKRHQTGILRGIKGMHNDCGYHAKMGMVERHNLPVD